MDMDRLKSLNLDADNYAGYIDFCRHDREFVSSLADSLLLKYK